MCLWEQASQRNAQQQLDRTDGNLEESMRQISVLEGAAAKASDRYTFLQDMRNYIADLCEMLDVSGAGLPSSKFA